MVNFVGWPWLELLHCKDNFQSVLHTLESLFKIFVLIHVRCHKMQHFATTHVVHEVNSKFHVNHHYGGKALYFVLSDITKINETMLML